MKKLKKRLTDEQLEKVSGGYGLDDDYSGEVSKYDVVVGQSYYVRNDYYVWFKGRLEKSWEKELTSCSTQRTHIYLIEDPGTALSSGYKGQHLEINADAYSFFKYKR